MALALRVTDAQANRDTAGDARKRPGSSALFPTGGEELAAPISEFGQVRTDPAIKTVGGVAALFVRFASGHTGQQFQRLIDRFHSIDVELTAAVHTVRSPRRCRPRHRRTTARARRVTPSSSPLGGFRQNSFLSQKMTACLCGCCSYCSKRCGSAWLPAKCVSPRVPDLLSRSRCTPKRNDTGCQPTERFGVERICRRDKTYPFLASPGLSGDPEVGGGRSAL